MRWPVAAGYLVFMLLLAGCASRTPAPPPAPTRTPAAPEVTNEALATSSPTPSPLAPSPTPASALATPTSTPASLQPTPAGASPSPTPTPQATVAPAAPGSASTSPCADTAAFYGDVTIPDNTSFKQNEKFTKTWSIKNEGTCAWDGYQLVFGGGDNMSGPLSAPLPLVKPGELASISVDLKAPNQGGLFTGEWEFQNRDGKRFGVNSGGIDFIWVKISVTYYPEGSTLPGVSTLAAPAGCAPRRDFNVVTQLLALINQARATQAQKPLPPLKLETRLSAAAQAHSDDMACKNYVDHHGSDGSTWFDRIKVQQYPYAYASENIGVADPAFGDYNWMFNWWMNSQVHRDNILSPKITEIGIAYSYYPGSQYKGYYTLDFARPSP